MNTFGRTAIHLLATPVALSNSRTNLQSIRIPSKPAAGSKTRAAFVPVSLKGVKKANLPSKDCVVCGRPFTWRKKWEKVWDDVKYCSERCRRDSKRVKQKSEQI
ncbi:hypothetical protein CYMTET_37874 [Cymbomonas tetramitiformis]|uniref:DUF2256 domain-containing protein n=1 Tax=Cymbomonas tetramitiformis TaxID=36881 RepID=A0AAE0CD71_9CHLO|nr:hypothetical protein CYMTET_37874 [Cymbomonas tetramitiformis]